METRVPGAACLMHRAQQPVRTVLRDAGDLHGTGDDRPRIIRPADSGGAHRLERRCCRLPRVKPMLPRESRILLSGVPHEGCRFRVAAPGARPVDVEAGEEFSESFGVLETAPAIASTVIVRTASPSAWPGASRNTGPHPSPIPDGRTHDEERCRSCGSNTSNGSNTDAPPGTARSTRRSR